MEEVEFICRECGWKGNSPAVKSWSEPSSTHTGPHGEDVHVPAHSGSMNICPNCNKMVQTQKEWESHDFWMKWIPRIIYSLMPIMIIALIYQFETL